MNTKVQETYSEVFGMLNMLGEGFINKLPEKLFNMIKEEKSSTYNPKYISDKSLSEQNVKRESLAMIALIHLNYWCETEEEKNELRAILNENEKKYQEEIAKKYNPFKNVDKDVKNIENETVSSTDNVALTEYKKSFISKIIDKIKGFLRMNL